MCTVPPCPSTSPSGRRRHKGPDPAASEAAHGTAGTGPVALFRYDALTASWWWSDEMFALHGFVPGEVVPTAELILAHKHPDDRPQARAMIEQVLLDGKPFCNRHRIITTTGGERRVVSIGEGVVANDKVLAVRGYLIDVTDAVRVELEQQTAEAVARSAVHRAAIEQAKGALMATYGITEVEAFQLLRGHSQNNNVKLSALAHYLAEQIATPEHAGQSPRRRIVDILAAVAEDPSVISG